MTKDLTQGPVARTLITFSLPLLLSTLLQQFYNLADSMIVGRFTGEAGLAAIGSGYPITLFFVAVGTGCSMGCSVVISRLFGAGEHDRLPSAALTAVTSFGVLGAVLSVAGVLLSGPLLTLLNAPGSIFGDARAYLAIYAAGTLACLLYNSAGGIFTGLGDSRTPLYLLVAASLLNVLLDYIAVGPLHLGVAGAAWATTLSQCVAAALALIILLRRMRGKRGRFDRALLSEMSSAAVPCILQQGCVALTHSVLQSLLNTFDTSIIAGYQAASRLHNLVYMSLNTLGTALSSFVGQCRGAGNYRRVRQGFWITGLIFLACAGVICLLFQLLPRSLIGLFIESGDGQAVIEVGITYLRVISPLYFPICFIVLTGALLRGTGRSTAFFVETVLELLVRIAACFLLTGLLAHYTGLLWGWCVGSCTGGVLCVIFCIHTFRTRLKDPESIRK